MRDHFRSITLMVLGAIVFGCSAALAATTISTNIQTDGNLSVTGTSVHTGLATFGNAFTTIFSAYGPAYFGATATSSFNSAGFLGILTAAPMYALDVTGIGHFTGLVDASKFVATSTTATSTFAGGFAVNTSGLVYDFQTGKVGIGTASPAASLDITSSSNTLLNLESSATYNQLQMTSYRNSATTHNLMYGLSARGSKASPSAVNSGDSLLAVRANGYGTTQFENSTDDSASIEIQADAAYTDSNSPGRITFATRPPGSKTFDSVRMVINGNGQVGIGLGASPTLTASLQVAATTTNATTTVELGKSGQNKGTCLALYDVTGTVQYVTVVGGALVVSSTSCK